MAPIKGNTEGQHKAGWLKVLGLKRWHVHAKNKYRASVIQKFQIWILEKKKIKILVPGKKKKMLPMTQFTWKGVKQTHTPDWSQTLDSLFWL